MDVVGVALTYASRKKEDSESPEGFGKDIQRDVSE
jgi:hypothetical protein